MANILMKRAPSFSAIAVYCKEFIEISLQNYHDKYLVLFFYPMDFTNVCTSEILALSDRLEEFNQRKCAIVGVSCDSQFTHLAWIQKLAKERGLTHINIPLLADKTGKIANDYYVYNKEEGISCSAFFIIDKQQVKAIANKMLVREVCINVGPVARSVDELLRLIDELKLADEKGLTAKVKRGTKRCMMEQEDDDDALFKSRKTSNISF